MSSQEIIKISDFQIQLVRSPRARHILLKQNMKGEIVLTYPKLCPKILAISFAKKQLPWIRAHVQYAPKEVVFRWGDSVSILGQEYLIQQGAQGHIENGILFVSGAPEFCHRRVCVVAQKMLQAYLHQKIPELTAQLGVKSGRIVLRNTSSRWGSCSSRKTLSFCWKIAFAPRDVIDYLIAHEVAHLKEMNHSPKFWAVVDSLVDHRKRSERWLKENGRKLQAIR